MLECLIIKSLLFSMLVHDIIKILLLVIGIFIIIGTTIPFLKIEFWWIRIFDFPRLQIIGSALLTLIFYTIFWDSGSFLENLFLLLLLAAILHQASVIYPYSPFHKPQVITCEKPGEYISFSLMVMNVYMYNRNSKKALEIIKENDPDIIINVETDLWWKEQFSELKQLYPHHILVPLENTYGMLLFSKYELLNPEIKYILVKDVPSIHTKIKIKDEVIRLYAVHPKPPAPGHSEKSTKRDAELITVGKETRNTEEPVIVAGDLNDVAWSYTTNLFQRFSELLDPRVGRGMFNTFHAKYKLMRWPLDHIFHSDHFQLIDLKTLDFFGSDHFPIYIELCLKPNFRHKQDEPEAEKDEVEFARDKVTRAKMQAEK